MSSSTSSSPEAEVAKWVLPRRDFLMLGSAAVASAAASSVAAATLRVVAAPSAGSILSVGYGEPAAPETETTSVVSARALRLSDDALRSAGVLVAVEGYSRPGAQNRDAVSVRLSTFAPAAEGPVPFLAWVHSTDGKGRTNSSPRSRFRAALDDVGTLPIAIERHEPAGRLSRLLAIPQASPSLVPDLVSMEQNGSVCRLSSGDRGEMALRAGTYYIALRRSSADRQPDWSSIVADNTVVSAGDSLRRNGNPVDFEYLTLTISYV